MVKFVTDINEAIEYEKRTGDRVLEYDEDGQPFLSDDYFDMPLSNEFSLLVDDDAEFYSLFVNPDWSIPAKVDFYDIKRGVYKTIIKNNKIVRIDQEYRP